MKCDKCFVYSSDLDSDWKEYGIIISQGHIADALHQVLSAYKMFKIIISMAENFPVCYSIIFLQFPPSQRLAPEQANMMMPWHGNVFHLADPFFFLFRFVYCHKTHSDTYRLFQVHKIQYDTGNIRNKSNSNIFINQTLFLLLDHWKEKNIWNIVWLTSQSTTVQYLEGKKVSYNSCICN